MKKGRLEVSSPRSTFSFLYIYVYTRDVYICFVSTLKLSLEKRSYSILCVTLDVMYITRYL